MNLYIYSYKRKNETLFGDRMGITHYDILVYFIWTVWCEDIMIREKHELHCSVHISGNITWHIKTDDFV